jgi:hypothetical protein
VTGRRWTILGNVVAVFVLLALSVAVWQVHDPVDIAFVVLILVASASVPFAAGVLLQLLVRRKRVSYLVTRSLGVLLAIALWVLGGKPLQLGESPVAGIFASVVLWAWSSEAGASLVAWIRSRRADQTGGHREGVTGEV